ncbi:MAG: Uma2 family endonuclease [Chloroflexi bacterium]|nr:Uma2 family endonuclease [Chloroflexota bacterium]
MTTAMTTQTVTRPVSQATPKSPATEEGIAPLSLKFEPAITMTDEQFEQFCAQNDVLRIERNCEGVIEIMPPASSETGATESEIVIDLGVWARADSRGILFGSSAGFTLPNGAVRSPDASWVLKSRLAALTPEQKRGFTQICPDFVVELRSPSDRLSVLQAKMEEYMANGARLGWLLDPSTRQAHIYRPGEPPEIIDNLASLSADPELPGFALDLQPIWEPAF